MTKAYIIDRERKAEVPYISLICLKEEKVLVEVWIKRLKMREICWTVKNLTEKERSKGEIDKNACMMVGGERERDE